MGKLRVLSHDSEAFLDRVEAGRLLAMELRHIKGKAVAVLCILRGGIIIASEIALKLGAALDIVLARKIGAPMNSELAIGAVSENGELFVNESVAARVGANDRYIQQEQKRQLSEIKRRGRIFRKVQPKVPIEGKTVIITDDGIATGATMQATLWAARQEKPRKLVVAVPVGPEDALKKISDDADEVICLKSPYPFGAVGQFYSRFNQVEDELVLETLKKIKEVRNETDRKT